MHNRPKMRAMSARSRLMLCGVCWLALTSVGTSPLFACNFNRLDWFEGLWKGRGTFREHPDAPREQIACFLQVEVDVETGIRTSGRCASPNETREIEGYLECHDGKLNGPLFAVAGEPRPRFIRDVSTDGETIYLMEIDDPETGKAQRYRLVLGRTRSDEVSWRVVRGAATVFNVRLGRVPE